jgi:hypothetical protein
MALDISFDRKPEKWRGAFKSEKLSKDPALDEVHRLSVAAMALKTTPGR